eukprot:COSAG01_NODE_2013_length_8643_cov_30.224081_9_plen_179_part_00
MIVFALLALTAHVYYAPGQIQIQGQAPIRQLQQYKYTGTALQEQPVPTGEYKMLGLFIANVSAVALASRQHALTAASARRHQHSSCSDSIAAAIERFVVSAPETYSPVAGQSGQARLWDGGRGVQVSIQVGVGASARGRSLWQSWPRLAAGCCCCLLPRAQPCLHPACGDPIQYRPHA